MRENNRLLDMASLAEFAYTDFISMALQFELGTTNSILAQRCLMANLRVMTYLPNLGRSAAATGALVLTVAALLTGCGERDAFDAQMQMLCAKDGGARIYETVTLPKNQFDKWGMPRGKNWDRGTLESKLDPDYRYSYSSQFLKRGNPLKGEVEMYRSDERIYREADGRLLGESVTYGRRGGDPYISLLLGGHPSSAVCPVQAKSFISSIFIQGE
jgi:hypothetical protein